MKDSFPEFYRPDDDELRQFVTEAVVVPDANVLLGLYRLSSQQRNDILNVLAAVNERLWIPYQVGLEYQRNRLQVLVGQAGLYDSLIDLTPKADLDTLRKKLDGLADLPVEVRAEAAELLEPHSQRLAEVVDQYRAAATALRDAHVVSREQGFTSDPVRERLDELFNGRVGPPPGSDKDLEDRVAEGQRRAEKKIPPGYEDKGKDSPERRAGDYLLWQQILDKAATDERRFLFVTSDVKDDWFQKHGKKIIGPRPELVVESQKYSKAGAGYFQVTLSDFLELANAHLRTEVPPETIQKTSSLVEERWRDLDARQRGASVGRRYIELMSERGQLDEAIKTLNSPAAKRWQQILNDPAYSAAIRRAFNAAQHGPVYDAEPDDTYSDDEGDLDPDRD